MSHKDNLDTIKSILNDSYTKEDTSGVPKKNDLTFGNTLKKMTHAVVFYVDMRGSRKIIQDATNFMSVKVHRAFLQAITYCVEKNGGHFRSFNGDGALAFFVGDTDATDAVTAAMQLKKYVMEINKIVEEKVSKKVNFGVGIGQGAVYVAKSGKRGDDSTKQDLVWVGLPVYVAVELSDLARNPNNVWISAAVKSSLDKQAKDSVLFDDDTGNSIWKKESKDLHSIGSTTVYKTSYYFKLGLE
jgi:adenylate cyclase